MKPLPAEIWRLIGDSLRPKDRLKLPQVCREWRSLFLRLAYQDVKLDGDGIGPLVCAIQLNPVIGSAIQALEINTWDVSKSDNVRGYYKPHLVKELIENLSQTSEEQGEWGDALKEENQDAWFGILLASLENLVSLSMYHPGWGEAIYVPKAIMRAGVKEQKPLTALQRLESVHVYNDDGKSYISTFELFPFFYLPSIRSINAECVVESHLNPLESDPEQLPPAPAPGISPLESLLIYGNGRMGMANYLRSCANLKIFIYQHTNQEIWGESYVGFRPKAIYNAISSQKHSLETLHLNDTGEADDTRFDHEADSPDYEDPGGWFGPLAEFSKLSDLRIRVSNALDLVADGSRLRSSTAATLPESLETLSFADCDEVHLSPLSSAISEIVSESKTRFPKLKKIAILPSYQMQETYYPRTIITKPIFYETFSPWKKVCQEAGIELLLGENE